MKYIEQYDRIHGRWRPGGFSGAREIILVHREVKARGNVL